MQPLRAIGDTLTLRLPCAEDVPGLFRHGSDPQVTRFFSWGPYTDPEQARAWVDRQQAERESGRQLDFAIVHREHGAIGVTGLTEPSRRDRRAVVGSWLGREHWGTGANDEAKALLCRIAFEALGLERVGAYASPQNPRSVAALEKLGWALEGTLRGFHRHGDVVHDVHVLGLLRADWQASRLHAIPGRVEGDPPPGWLFG